MTSTAATPAAGQTPGDRQQADQTLKRPTAGPGLAALGIVYGDLGTSPL